MKQVKNQGRGGHMLCIVGTSKGHWQFLVFSSTREEAEMPLSLNQGRIWVMNTPMLWEYEMIK
jgi:hypothetical protein